MKFRYLAIGLVAATMAGFGWHDSQRLAEVRKQRDSLLAKAADPGLDSKNPAAVRHKAKVRELTNQPPPGKAVPPDDIAYMKEGEAKHADRKLSPEQEREQFGQMMGRLKEMNVGQIRHYVDEVAGIEDLSEQSRKMMISMAIGVLTDNHPAEGFDLCIELMEKSDSGSPPMPMDGKMAGWTAKDPSAALAWMRTNLPSHGECIGEMVRCQVIFAIASSDRKLAFRLIGDLGIETPANATQYIVGCAKSADERTAALADLREYLPTIEAKGERFRAGDYAVAVLGRNLAKEGFSSASAWAESAGLTSSELVGFASDLGDDIKDGEQGKWVDWLGKKLPDGKFQRPVRGIMRSWTAADYQAAGTWLGTAADGPVKNQAIASFAEEVANQEPQSAVQWAVTLPPGTLRENTLHKIYHNWPTNDDSAKAAAAAFEKEYGIQHDH